jgi:hypothetical protein
LGVIHNTGFYKGIGGVDVVNNYYGRGQGGDASQQPSNLTLGAYRGQWGSSGDAQNSQDSYTSTIENDWPSDVQNYDQVRFGLGMGVVWWWFIGTILRMPPPPPPSLFSPAVIPLFVSTIISSFHLTQVPNEVDAYRTLLQGAADGSVVIASIGEPLAIRNILEAELDLFVAKVKEVGSERMVGSKWKVESEGEVGGAGKRSEDCDVGDFFSGFVFFILFLIFHTTERTTNATTTTTANPPCQHNHRFTTWTEATTSGAATALGVAGVLGWDPPKTATARHSE